MRFGKYWLCCLAGCYMGLAQAATFPYAASERADVAAFVDDMAKRHGFDRDWVAQWLKQAQRSERILEAISRPAERTLEWEAYRRIFIRPEQIEQGLAFLAKHEETFARAEAELGVSRYIAAAIIGVETRYGRFMGPHRVLDALATLGFDYPPRSDFFRRQLGEYFLLVREQGFNPADIKGSYAGAMGYGQFIPGSYRHYAIDFDGDGVVDILTNPVDAIGSVANYFREHRWQPGRPIAERLPGTLPDDSPLLTQGLRPTLTVADYRAAGLTPGKTVQDSEPARAIQVLGEDGPELWLTYHNFYVITRYNHSHLYAMAVHELARLLEAGSAAAGSDSDV